MIQIKLNKYKYLLIYINYKIALNFSILKIQKIKIAERNPKHAILPKEWYVLNAGIIAFL